MVALLREGGDGYSGLTGGLHCEEVQSGLVPPHQGRWSQHCSNSTITNTTSHKWSNLIYWEVNY